MKQNIIPDTSTLNRIPKVLADRKMKDRDGKVVSTKVTIPAHQLSNVDHTEIVYTQSMKGVPQNLFRNQGAKFSATLEQKSFAKIVSMCIRIEVSHDQGETELVCVPPTYWFSRIEFRASDGSKYLNIVYDDNMHFSMITSPHNIYKSNKQLIGIGRDDPQYWNINLSSRDQVHLPLLGSWVDTADLWFKNIQGDIVVDFYPRGNLVSEGVQGEISCQTMEFVIQTEDLDEKEMALQNAFHSTTAAESHFLDIVPVNFYSQRLSPQTQTKLELDAVEGDIAFLSVYVKPRVAGANIVNPLDIGNKARIDLLTPGSKSILGAGTGISLDYLKHFVLPQHTENEFLIDHDNIIIVPFCSSVTKAFFGVKSGSMYLDGSRYYLSITPDETFTNGEYDVTIYAYKYASLLNNKGKISIHYPRSHSG